MCVCPVLSMHSRQSLRYAEELMHSKSVGSYQFVLPSLLKWQKLHYSKR